MGRAKQYCLFLSVFVIYVCLKREKNLTLKTCAPDFSAGSMTKLYAKIKGARAISLFDFPKTWQVWGSKFFPLRVTPQIRSDIVSTIKVKNKKTFIFQRVWKTVKCQGKIREKSGNFEVNVKWQPCV